MDNGEFKKDEKQDKALKELQEFLDEKGIIIMDRPQTVVRDKQGNLVISRPDFMVVYKEDLEKAQKSDNKEVKK